MHLSILILTHNRPHLFKRCLESVLAQIRPGIEVLVNNDSCDIKEIEHPQVKYFYHNPNSLCEIYKFLLVIAQGDYVYYLEDDDYLVSDFLEQDFRDDLIVGNYCPTYETPDMLTFMTLYKDEYKTTEVFLANLNTEHLQLSQHIFKRHHISNFNFPNDSNIHNDIKLVIHAAHRARSIKTVKKVFYYQTIDGGDNISFPKYESVQ
jgi:glycosyltransferase involved in cell wall biosynthesis